MHDQVVDGLIGELAEFSGLTGAFGQDRVGQAGNTTLTIVQGNSHARPKNGFQFVRRLGDGERANAYIVRPGRDGRRFRAHQANRASITAMVSGEGRKKSHQSSARASISKTAGIIKAESATASCSITSGSMMGPDMSY